MLLTSVSVTLIIACMKFLLNISIAFGILVPLLVLPPCLSAQGKPPYGKSDEKGYGEKRPVGSAEEAKKALSKFFSGEGLTVGKVKEKEYFFEAEVLDKNKNVVDKVIIDKRTGRIRSIY